MNGRDIGRLTIWKVPAAVEHYLEITVDGPNMRTKIYMDLRDFTKALFGDARQPCTINYEAKEGSTDHEARGDQDDHKVVTEAGPGHHPRVRADPHPGQVRHRDVVGRSRDVAP
jgi:hypothetical protein